MNEVLAIRCDIHKFRPFFSSTLGNPTERWERSASSGASMAFLKVSYLPRWRSLRCRFQKRNETKIGRHDACNLRPSYIFSRNPRNWIFRETGKQPFWAEKRLWSVSLLGSKDPTSKKSRLSLPPSPGRGIFATPAVCQVELVRKLRDMEDGRTQVVPKDVHAASYNASKEMYLYYI